MLYGIWFVEWLKKTFSLSDKKVRRKNQIPKYYAPSPKEYNKKDMKLIDKKPPNPMGNWGGKPDDL